MWQRVVAIQHIDRSLHMNLDESQSRIGCKLHEFFLGCAVRGVVLFICTPSEMSYVRRNRTVTSPNTTHHASGRTKSGWMFWPPVEGTALHINSQVTIDWWNDAIMCMLHFMQYNTTTKHYTCCWCGYIGVLSVSRYAHPNGVSGGQISKQVVDTSTE